MKIAMLFLMLVTVLSIHADAGSTDSAGIQKALVSRKDRYGIPVELYKLDYQLDRYKKDIDSQIESGKSQGAIFIISGIVGLAMGGALFAIAANNAKEADRLRSDPDYIVIQDPSPMQYATGAITCAISFGLIGVGVSKMDSKPDAGLLKRYYNRKYGTAQSGLTMHMSLDFQF